MAKTSKLPTARKAPQKSTAGKFAGSKGTTKKQPRKSSESATSSTSQRKRSTSSQGLTSTGRRRKTKGQNMVSTKTLPTNEDVKDPSIGMLMAPVKSENMHETGMKEDVVMPQLPNEPVATPSIHFEQSQAPLYPQVPQTNTSPAQTFNGGNSAHSMASDLLFQAIRSDPTLLPPDPTNSPITSAHIDAIAHVMWQIALQHNFMLQVVCQYSAMFSQLKLSALAKLNFLPSWWFMREMAVKMLGSGGRGWNLDDGEMDKQWREACYWCKGVIERNKAGCYVMSLKNEEMMGAPGAHVGNNEQ